VEKGGNVTAFLAQKGICTLEQVFRTHNTKVAWGRITKVAWGRTWKSVSHTRWEPMVRHLLGGVWDPHIPGASVTKCGAARKGVFYLDFFLSSLECFRSGSAVSKS
jgi:hypothetical protein